MYGTDTYGYTKSLPSSLLQIWTPKDARLSPSGHKDRCVGEGKTNLQIYIISEYLSSKIFVTFFESPSQYCKKHILNGKLILQVSYASCMHVSLKDYNIHEKQKHHYFCKKCMLIDNTVRTTSQIINTVLYKYSFMTHAKHVQSSTNIMTLPYHQNPFVYSPSPTHNPNIIFLCCNTERYQSVRPILCKGLMVLVME